MSETNIFAALAAPFPPDAVSWRVGSTNKKQWAEGKPRRGQALAYIDARDVMDRLDEVLGPENWQDDYAALGAGTVICRLSLRINGEWLSKTDVAGQTDMEAEKGQISDALKRAAVKWGCARYLYGIGAPWLTLDDWWHIKDADMPTLRALLPGNPPAAPPKSAREARSDGNWQRIEAEVRMQQDPTAVAEVLRRNLEIIKRWPKSWQDLMREEGNRCKEALKIKQAAS